MFSSCIDLLKDAIESVVDFAFDDLFPAFGALGFLIFFILVYIFFSRVLGLQIIGTASDKVKQGAYNLTHKDSKVTIRRS